MSRYNQRLIINNLGPIKHCDISLRKLTVLCGPQARGKSTIAKSIFFFRKVKNFLAEALVMPKNDPVIELEFCYTLHEKFQQVFGRLNNFPEDMSVAFEYAPGIVIEISNWRDGKYPIRFSENIKAWASKYFDVPLGLSDLQRVKNETEKFFRDNCETIYIPAGRSMLSILSEALSYVFFRFTDREKSLIDFCTSDYIEQVTSIKSVFTPEPRRYESLTHEDERLRQLRNKAEQILQGRYFFTKGSDYLRFNADGKEKDIGLKFASSGQQEVLWILNLIYYYASTRKPAFFIVEEPEAHLYPNTQKDVAEYVVTALSEKNECLLTTHSPYILGTLNNILDARRLLDKGVDVSQIVTEEKIPLLASKDEIGAYFVGDSEVVEALDDEIGLIKNELIDDASDVINNVADKLIEAERADNE